MTSVADRLSEAMQQGGWSQGRLAREIHVTQGAISQILLGKTQRSRYLPDIADALSVPLEWLRGAPVDRGPVRPAPPEVVADTVLMRVSLPPEEALVEAYRALLSICRGMDEDELARELAKRLPTVLRVTSDAIVAGASAEDVDQLEAAPFQHGARSSPRRAASNR